tara:strand:+ start:1001 stop:1315 length:315 start_codon:yes stop_codon:yes gene_type:complete
MKVIIKILFLLFLFTSFVGCKTMREGLDASKNKGSEAFLVKKKNPLVLPPDFEKLPKPKSNDKKENITDIKSLFNNKNLNSKNKTGEINLSIKKLVEKEIKKNN